MLNTDIYCFILFSLYVVFVLWWRAKLIKAAGKRIYTSGLGNAIYHVFHFIP